MGRLDFVLKARRRDDPKTTTRYRATTSARIKYRTDIDGLRALAVVSIVVFHLNPSALRGGFIGVDIFFVISGFLIIGIIQHELQIGTFSLSEFYAKRCRRILPAMFFMLLVCSGAAWCLLLPSELVDFSKSLASASVYASNIYFYFLIDYFRNSNAEALVHTWSLGVEEQFYLVIPIALFVAFKLTRRAALPLLYAIRLLSFAIGWYLTRHDPSAAFYLVPARMWQFCCGGICAICAAPRFRGIALSAIAAAALIGLVSSVWLIDGAMAFPGYLALLPTISCAALLWTGRDSGTLVSRTLSVPPLRFFGTISDSMYLFHWPIIVFYKVAVSPDLNGREQFWLFAASTLAGTLSFVGVELPTRKIAINDFPFRWIAGGGAASAIFCAMAGACIAYRGVPGTVTTCCTRHGVLSRLSRGR